ncbi:3-oxoacyl-(acyl-carrier-protein) reductase FabG [Candidatus Xenohaliotis californiensis]|uniref:3-oxoacyl-(Acyl-carrier-protein) reductase FabG n=1 Tax=Candidatus Xenohaliotis californiensis TaxID=84677 RepID=A0ABP0EZ48_9RICK|nr:3-oxoacyl-(acyl-carrier-protein) reductase FabG [Candidatus Xenohaliotis californiensis]
MFDLHGKVALITGASGGIGGAIAKLFYRHGAIVILSGTNQNKLTMMQNNFSENERVYTIRCDLSNREEVRGLVDKANQINNGVDILICNAGITKDALAIRMKDGDWDDIMEINLRSVFILNREFCRSMMKKKWGRIINISSIVAFTGNYGQANYAAAKGAMVSLTKTMALEFASRNITINCIAPGFIDTNMTKVLNDQQKERAISNVPMGFIGNPMDIACGALYLASDGARYVTGHSLHINGGMFMS